MPEACSGVYLVIASQQPRVIRPERVGEQLPGIPAAVDEEELIGQAPSTFTETMAFYQVLGTDEQAQQMHTRKGQGGSSLRTV